MRVWRVMYRVFELCDTMEKLDESKRQKFEDIEVLIERGILVGVNLQRTVG